MPKVSVILPFYNAGSTLARAIDSIVAQSFNDWELILINNNSTDEGRSIAERYARDYSSIVLVSEPKQGVVYAANKGMAMAKGHYFARMDADDFASPNRLELQVGFLDRNSNVGMVGSCVNYVAHRKNTEGFKRYVDWQNSLLTSEQIEQNRFIELPLIQPTICFRSELYKMHGGYLDGNFPEDYEFQLRLLHAGVRFHKLKEKLLDWYDADTRLTRTDARYKVEQFYEMKTRYVCLWLKEKGISKLWIWGAGKESRRRAELLTKHGISIAGFIDVKNYRLKAYACIRYNEFDWSKNSFVISYVGNYGARGKIREYLTQQGKKELSDFLIVA